MSYIVIGNIYSGEVEGTAFRPAEQVAAYLKSKGMGNPRPQDSGWAGAYWVFADPAPVSANAEVVTALKSGFTGWPPSVRLYSGLHGGPKGAFLAILVSAAPVQPLITPSGGVLTQIYGPGVA